MSANSNAEIGRMISEAMQKVGNEGVITIEEAKGIQTEFDVVEGMQFDCGYVSPHFITDAEKMIAELDQRWPGKFGQADKWKICLKAVRMPQIRSEHDEAGASDPQSGYQGEGGPGD